MSFWTYVIIAFSTLVFLAFALFFYLKCSKHRKQNRFAQRLANCFNDEKTVTGEITVKDVVSASSQTDEVVSHKPGGRFFSTPTLKEAEITMDLLLKGAET